jgi:hypothetical protein
MRITLAPDDNPRKVAPLLEPRHRGPYYGYAIRDLLESEPRPVVSRGALAWGIISVIVIGACAIAAVWNV